MAGRKEKGKHPAQGVKLPWTEEGRVAKRRKMRWLEQEEVDFIRSYMETQLADFLMPEEILTGPHCSDPDEMMKANESMAELVQEIGEELVQDYDAKGYLEVPTDLRAPTAPLSKP